MLVSHRYKFIYTKTLKTAGTSVEAYFERFCMDGEGRTLAHQRGEYVSPTGIIGFRGRTLPTGTRWWNHMPAAMIKERLGDETWAGYFKFCVVRNPYEKAISFFSFNFHLQGQDANKPDGLEEARQQLETWLSTVQMPVDRDKYLIDGIFSLDEVLRYETLATDFERVCNRLAIPWEPASLPTLKAGHRPDIMSAAALYTDRARGRRSDLCV